MTMKASEWALLVAFAVGIWGISFVSPDAAVLLGGFTAAAILVESGALARITSLVKG